MFKKFEPSEIRIGVIGLGYVGLPLAVEFGQKLRVKGFDVNQSRIAELKNGLDITDEVENILLKNVPYLTLTSDLNDLKDCDFYIITVPTPIDSSKTPNLSFIKNASKAVGKILNPGDIVVYESTVFPGCTEEICVPILQKFSNLIYNEDFFCGYSPERINPGDKKHRLPDITKVTSGSTNSVAEFVNVVYQQIIKAGTHLAPSIKVAEAAKVIENTQRDLNIALMNELSIIFNKLELNTEDVLNAAETKWNFLPFRPGLVGGHCISVDPYYLTHKAQQIGYHPEIILSGRRVNDNMAAHTASLLVKAMGKKHITFSKAKVLILGIAFKEDCPDIRNTKVFNLFCELKDYGLQVDVHDPVVSFEDVYEAYELEMIIKPKKKSYDAIVLAVSHTYFKQLGIEKIKEFGSAKHVFFDIKWCFPADEVDVRL